MENKKVGENPARLVKLLRENNERVRYLEHDEERRLRKAIRARWPEREPELDLALNTGMRWSEQYNLRWEDVNFKTRLITIPLAKSGKRETIPINSDAITALAKLRAVAPNSEFVCNVKHHTHRDWWEAALDAAEITDFHWHDLRHTFASRLVMNGVDILTVNKLLRHKVLQVTMRYSHLAATHLHDAVRRLAGVTGSVTTPDDSKSVTTYVH
jgi:integrase